ncbi:UNVERIFIED_CONTAM: hypothetical protein K2H54_045458 [Gekko kuhli]
MNPVKLPLGQVKHLEEQCTQSQSGWWAHLKVPEKYLPCPQKEVNEEQLVWMSEGAKSRCWWEVWEPKCLQEVNGKCLVVNGYAGEAISARNWRSVEIETECDVDPKTSVPGPLVPVYSVVAKEVEMTQNELMRMLAEPEKPQ